jgi:hemolysin D
VQLNKRLLDQSLAARQEKTTTLNIEIERCSAEHRTILANARRLTESLPLTRDLFEKKKILAEKNLISRAELLQAQIEMNDAHHNLQAAESQLQEAAARLERSREEKDLAQTEYRRDLLRQLTEATNSKENLTHQLAKAENRQTHFDLKAPADGIVQQLSINTIGGVVTAAQPLMIIVPTDGGLEIEAKVLNKDIGFVAQDQEVSVKVTAYPFTQYGDLAGKIEWVARDAVVDKDLGPNYPIRVSIAHYNLPNIVGGRQGVITPGMTVAADIKVGNRRVIEYFLGPIMRYKDQSLREM